MNQEKIEELEERLEQLENEVKNRPTLLALMVFFVAAVITFFVGNRVLDYFWH